MLTSERSEQQHKNIEADYYYVSTQSTMSVFRRRINSKRNKILKY